MSRTRLSPLLALLVCLGLLLVPATSAQARPLAIALPDGFTEEWFVQGLSLPTGFAVAPDGRIYITEKAGKVRVVEDGVLLDEPFIDLTAEVNDSADRGLLSVALHPRFPAVPYVYLAYTYDPPEAKAHSASGARVSRVLRLEADPADPSVHRPGSGVVILGTNSTFEHIGNPDQGDAEPFTCFDDAGGFVRDCLPAEGTGHSIDFLKFGRDGALYVSLGDGIVNSKGNWRAQSVDSLAGKILRIDPITGTGLPSNPFYDGDPASNRSKVYALGMRNPFRFTLHPTTGELYLGDVGNTTWEEINRGGAGSNFGWPCFEGMERMANFDICNPLFDGTATVNYAIYMYPHKPKPPLGAAVGGDFYTGRNFPAEYRNAYFWTDFNGGVVYVMFFKADGSYTLREFATSAPGPIQIATGPDGNLWLLYIATGTMGRIRWVGGGAGAAAASGPSAGGLAARATPRAGAGAAALPTATPKAGTAAAAPAASALSSAGAGGTGAITRELWPDLSGETLEDLTGSADFPGSPGKVETLTVLDIPRAGVTNYGERIRGYIYPPVSGQYRFWIAADDAAQLSLSSDADPANAVIIASVPRWTPMQVWDKFPEQESVLIELEAGRRYYIEILHKQGGNKENLTVAWQPPGGTREVVEGKYLSPFE